jgi:hypothetical protein
LPESLLPPWYCSATATSWSRSTKRQRCIVSCQRRNWPWFPAPTTGLSSREGRRLPIAHAGLPAAAPRLNRSRSAIRRNLADRRPVVGQRGLHRGGPRDRRQSQGGYQYMQQAFWFSIARERPSSLPCSRSSGIRHRRRLSRRTLRCRQSNHARGDGLPVRPYPASPTITPAATPVAISTTPRGALSLRPHDTFFSTAITMPRMSIQAR